MDCHPSPCRKYANAEQKDGYSPRPRMVCVCVLFSEMFAIHVNKDSYWRQHSTENPSMAKLRGILITTA